MSAYCYTQSESTQRVPIRWTTTQVPIIFQHNPTDVSATDSMIILSEVLSLWNSQVPFTIQSSGYGRNTLSYSTDTRIFGPGVVAVTMLSYNPAEGKVSDGQIYINQTATRGFCLTADKSANNCTTPGAGFLQTVYLGDVISHEIGHFMGLGHSEVRDSSMVFTNFRGQFSPHADDIAGVKSIYNSTGTGTINGTLMGGNNVPVFGGHIQAISNSTGKVAASAISQEDGAFAIVGLSLNDSYYLYIEPLKRLESLADAYRSAKKEFCPSAYVGSFFESCGTDGKGHPQPLALSSSRSSINVGTVTIRCQLRVGDDYLLSKVSDGSGVYSFNASLQKPSQTFVGLYSADETLSSSDYESDKQETIELDLTALTVPSGTFKLELNLLTTGIGSPLDFSVEIDGPTGIKTDPDRPSVGGVPYIALESGTLRAIYDRKLLYSLSTNPSLNRVTIRLRPRAISANEQSGQMISPDIFSLTERPWFLMVNILSNDQIYYQSKVTTLSDNASCLDAPFTFAVRPNPVSAAALAGIAEEGTDSQAVSTGPACGSWEPPDSSGGNMSGMVLSMLLGFLLLFIRKPHRN